MTTLVVGANGATGRLLVAELLQRGHGVRAVVRSSKSLPAEMRDNPQLTVIEASVLDLTDGELARHVRGCGAVVSCLGHNLTFQGLFGPPWRLVTAATRRLCTAIKASESDEPVRFVLMNTTGVRNRDLDERISFSQKIVTGLLRLLLPPHADNEAAANYLRKQIRSSDAAIDWAVVRPDGLIDEDRVTEYELHASPIRSAIFDPGKTSRINVAHFMAELATDEMAWNTWKGRMPVIYNR
ncbi:MAG: SDR family oxidoreductase [Fuerstiella sp.]